MIGALSKLHSAPRLKPFCYHYSNADWPLFHTAFYLNATWTTF